MSDCDAGSSRMSQPVCWLAKSARSSSCDSGVGRWGPEADKKGPSAAVIDETAKAEWETTAAELKAAPAGEVMLRMHHDEDAEVYVNGVLAARVTGFTTAYVEVPLTPAGRAALRPGRNVIAIHCRQTGGGQYIDAGLVEVK